MAADLWWKSVFREVRERTLRAGRKFDTDQVNTALRALNEAEVLRLFEVQPVICGCPVAVFDPDSSDPAGFNLYYHTGPTENYPGPLELVSVAKMDPGYLQDWKEHVYFSLAEGKGRKAVPYKNNAPDTT